MDNHSRSSSPHEPARPQHRPPSPPSLPSPLLPPLPPSPGAFDNRGFQHDDPNHNDSFASNQTHHNTHIKEKNGDSTTLEAVNLELINLQPKNGHGKKKEVEVDMNASNPYDEYFVPVNEHRKYMRGEKLYVTADKRGEKGGCWRPLCWALLALGAAAAVALAALAATGVLFDKSPTPVEQYNASISSARALGGIGHVHHDHSLDDSRDEDLDRAHLQDQHVNNGQMEPTTPIQQGNEIQNDEETVHAEDSQETGDAYIYVPRTVEGELKIDNEEFTAALADPDSDEYKTFTESFNNALKEALFPKNGADSRDNELFVEVVQLRKGSVIVTYRINWKPKSNTKPTDIITPNGLKANLNNYLSNNNRMLSVYYVAEDKIETRLVLNLCQINKNNCDYGCEFDKSTLDFTCTCPKGQMLDINSPRKCISLFESNLTEDTKQIVFNVTDTDSNPRTLKPVSKKELNSESTHKHPHQNIFDWKETNHVIPEKTTETDPDLKFSHIFGHQSNENENSQTRKPDLSPKNAYSVAVTEIMPELSSGPEFKPESPSQLEPSSKPEPTLEPESAGEAVPSSEPVSVSEAEGTSVPEPAPQHELIDKLESSTEPKPNVEPEPVSKFDISLKLEHISETEPKTESEPTFEPDPTTESNYHYLSETGNSTFQLKSATEIKPEPEPTNISEQSAESKFEQATEHEPERQKIPESEPTFEPEKVAAPNIKYESETELVLNLTSKPEFATEQKLDIELKAELEKNIKSNFEFILQSESTTAEVLPEEKPDLGKKLEPETQIESKVETKLKMGLTRSEEVTSEPELTSKFEQGTESNLFYFHGTKQRSSTKQIIEKNSTLKESSKENTTTVAPKLSASPKINLPAYSAKVNETNDSTTTRVSISEFHIINEPSYEASPEILSILRQTSQKINDSSYSHATTDENKYYSDSDWLEDDKNLKALTNDKSSYSDSGLMHITKARAFSDVNLIATNKPNNTEYELPFDKMAETNEVSMSDIEVPKIEEPTTALISPSYIETDYTTTSPLVNIFHDEKITVIGLNGTVDHVNDTTIIKEDSITHILDLPIEINDTHQILADTTTANSNNIELYTENNVDTMKEKYLIETLSNHENNGTQSVKEEKTGDNMDITFDTISMLFNLSSKSGHKQDHTINNIVTTDANIFLKESTTTDSDWLSESAMEINYEEIINKITRGRTTESNINKIEDMIIHDTPKDDFEPDYLNNMGVSMNKMKESDDIGIYGMAHDYDNEESRVKRVHAELKTNNLLVTAEGSKLTDSPNTTTVSENIFKVPERSSNQCSESDCNTKEIIPTNKHQPAPIWEASDHDKDIGTTKGSIKSVTNTSEELGNTSQNTTLVNNFNVTIYEISALNLNNTVSIAKHINSQSSEYDDHETEMNPFLPEIENNKNFVKKLQEGHDLEPLNVNETQNENIDERSISTEKQKENTRNDTSTVRSIISESNNFKTIGTDTILDDLFMNIPSDSHELSSEIMNNVKKNDSSTYKIIIDTLKDKNEEDNLPISRFLMDTDDLDREHTTEHRPTVIQNNLENESSSALTLVPKTVTMSTKITDESNDYLSVVPITQNKDEEKEVLKKNYKSENILELNDISDSPKKSARRTLDLTK